MICLFVIFRLFQVRRGRSYV